MAEAAGLVIGAVGLAGLFSSCLECLNLVQTTQRYSQDVSVLRARYQLEKLRFITWGQAAGLQQDQSHYGNILDNPHVHQLVEHALLLLKMLFNNTNELASKYGLQATEDAANSGEVVRPGSLQSTFATRFAKFTMSVAKQQKTTKGVRKLKWAIRDRERFQCLVEDTKALIDLLEGITKDVRPRAQRMAREDLESLTNPEDIQLVQQVFAESSDAGSELHELASSVWGDDELQDLRQQRVREWSDGEDRVVSGSIARPSSTFPGGMMPPDEALAVPERSSFFDPEEPIMNFAKPWDGQRRPGLQISLELVVLPAIPEIYTNRSLAFANPVNNRTTLKTAMSSLLLLERPEPKACHITFYLQKTSRDLCVVFGFCRLLKLALDQEIWSPWSINPCEEFYNAVFASYYSSHSNRRQWIHVSDSAAALSMLEDLRVHDGQDDPSALAAITSHLADWESLIVRRRRRESIEVWAPSVSPTTRERFPIELSLSSDPIISDPLFPGIILASTDGTYIEGCGGHTGGIVNAPLIDLGLLTRNSDLEVQSRAIAAPEDMLRVSTFIRARSRT